MTSPADIREQALAQPRRPRLEPRDRLPGGLDRRSLRHRHRSRFDVGLERGGEAEAGPSRRHRPTVRIMTPPPTEAVR